MGDHIIGPCDTPKSILALLEFFFFGTFTRKRLLES